MLLKEEVEYYSQILLSTEVGMVCNMTTFFGIVFLFIQKSQDKKVINDGKSNTKDNTKLK